MGIMRVYWHFPLFFFCLFFSSGSSVAEKPPLEVIQHDEIMGNEEKRILFSPSLFTYNLDSIPVVNPTPTPTTPIANPIGTEPNITPTPTTTTPTAPTTPTPTAPSTTTPTAPTTTTPTAPTTTTPTAPTTTTPTAPTTTTPSSGGSWCIANPSAAETALQVALDYACGYGGADCSALQSGASCSNPNTVRDHASYAFNDYYQKNPAPTSCVFGGTAQLTSTDPSSGSCRYASSKPASTTSSSSSPPATPTMETPPTFMTPPSPTTPAMSTPAGTSVYGSEPTGMPSSAISFSPSTISLFITTSLLGSIFAANYI
ncbi:hypothetical protein UlMin_018840 [Ulmus minor]